MPILIKIASIDDVLALQAISKTTFLEAFAKSNTEADMALYLHEQLSVDQLRTELENPNSAFYFASINDQVIGYLKINFSGAQTEIQSDEALEIERIYVLQQFQDQQIGTMLLQKAMQKAQELQATYVWLGVWEHNKKAIGFYQKHGFVAFDQHIFKLGNDEQTDILMKIAI